MRKYSANRQLGNKFHCLRRGSHRLCSAKYLTSEFYAPNRNILKSRTDWQCAYASICCQIEYVQELANDDAIDALYISRKEMTEDLHSLFDNQTFLSFFLYSDSITVKSSLQGRCPFNRNM